MRNARGGALTARVKTHCGHTLPLILHPHAHWWLWVEDADEKTLWDYVRHARREYRTVMPLAMPAAKQLGTDTREAERAGASDAIENNAIRFLRPLKRGGLAGRRARAPLTAMLRRSGAQLRKAIEGVLHAPVLAARGGSTSVRSPRGRVLAKAQSGQEHCAGRSSTACALNSMGASQGTAPIQNPGSSGPGDGWWLLRTTSPTHCTIPCGR